MFDAEAFVHLLCSGELDGSLNEALARLSAQELAEVEALLVRAYQRKYAPAAPLQEAQDA